MDDLELLERYEPVLRFAKSERFFPMAVEPYLEKCMLFPSGPAGAAEWFAHLNEPLADKIGSLNSHEYFLRFVNKPFYSFDVWLWWAGLSAVGLTAGWFIFGALGAGIALGLVLTALLILFMFISPLRLRIMPAMLAVLFFLALGIAPIWLFFRPIPGVSIAVEYLVFLPIYLLLLFYLLTRTLKFIIEKILSEGFGLAMDALSLSTERVALASGNLYADILRKNFQPVYYGRVLRESDADGNQWTILQYHFFYAFNDWRLAANGFNHHEGDWELLAVYLKNDEPCSVLLSQHGAGHIESWENMIKARDEGDNETLHPVVYVALGSHANYSRPDVIRSPVLYKPGRTQRLLSWTDGWVRYLFLLFNPNQEARQIALEELRTKNQHLLDEHAFDDLRDELDHYIVSLPMEIATGDGFRVGYQGGNSKEPLLQSSAYLKRTLSDRAVSRPPRRDWQRILLNSKQGWVQYKGLWGVKGMLREESGPSGPKWEKLRGKETVIKERVRWGKPLEWLAELEDHKH